MKFIAPLLLLSSLVSAELRGHGAKSLSQEATLGDNSNRRLKGGMGKGKGKGKGGDVSTVAPGSTTVTAPGSTTVSAPGSAPGSAPSSAPGGKGKGKGKNGSDMSAVPTPVASPVTEMPAVTGGSTKSPTGKKSSGSTMPGSAMPGSGKKASSPSPSPSPSPGKGKGKRGSHKETKTPKTSKTGKDPKGSKNSQPPTMSPGPDSSTNSTLGTGLTEQSLPIVGFEYETQSRQAPAAEEYEELARVTAEVFDEMYAAFFKTNPLVDYDTTALKQYTALSPLLVSFDLETTFEEGSIPSIPVLKIAADRSFTGGQTIHSTYLQRLQAMSSPVFSTTTSFRLISDAETLAKSLNRAKEESEPSFWEENLILVVAPVAAAAALLILCCYCRYCRTKRAMTMDELRGAERKAASNNDNSDSTTYVSDYRTSVFSEDMASKADTYRYDEGHETTEPIYEDEMEEILEEIPVEEEEESYYISEPAAEESSFNAFEEEQVVNDEYPVPVDTSYQNTQEETYIDTEEETNYDTVEAKDLNSDAADGSTPEWMLKFKEMGLQKHG